MFAHLHGFALGLVHEGLWVLVGSPESLSISIANVLTGRNVFMLTSVFDPAILEKVCAGSHSGVDEEEIKMAL